MQIKSSLISFFLSAMVVAQPAEYKMSGEEYIDAYKDDAIKEMLSHGVPASITLSQGMLESGNGNSALAVYANNHFGIKCHGNWKGPTFIQDDDEKNECFRKYSSVYESFSDHSEFLRSRSRYALLFELKTTDYKGWARGLKQAGYATDPNYADRLIDLIETNKLYELDRAVTIPNISNAGKKVAPAANLTLRKIMYFNNIKYVTAKEGDSFFKIANEADVEVWQVLKYNDFRKTDKIIAGQKIYIQPKRRKAKEEYHTVEKGETMKSISQMHGIKLKHLYKKNLMKPGEEPKPGIKLYLRKKKKA